LGQLPHLAAQRRNLQTDGGIARLAEQLGVQVGEKQGCALFVVVYPKHVPATLGQDNGEVDGQA
jgi:hypothetical protein